MRPEVRVHGMLGIGDNLFQRAALRELLKTKDVHLGAWYSAMFADLVPLGLKVGQFVGTQQRIREEHPVFNATVPHASNVRLTYSSESIRRHGSILGAIYGAVGLKMPDQPDFSLPVPPAWRELARRVVGAHDKPLLVYRPIVLNDVWRAPLRSPDAESYTKLFATIRDRFFVVSVADLNQREEIVAGTNADLTLHNGELSFEALAGLFAEASLVFANPGFAPVLAQAVGTPVVIVYGGNECFQTTNAVGAHLSPTLAIEPARPCDCHVGKGHCGRGCDKRIDLEAARPKLMDFAATAVGAPRVLIFGTCYVDSEHRKHLVERWVTLHGKLNPRCDLLLVDSASPLYWHADGSPSGALPKARIESFPDNIGHLSRGGRDGWGRAFCAGLQAAIDGGYDYVVHIEGDSLCRLDVAAVIAEMRRGGLDCATVPVTGTKRQEIGWVETGLMFFRVGYLSESDFINRYDWPRRTKFPTPEAVIFRLLGRHLTMMPWKAERGDKSQITTANVGGLDWVTHCWDHDEVYEAFIDGVDGARSVKLNFGCGTNKLPGWQNFDEEIDIAKPLPFASGSADFIFAEHVVEHVTQYQALDFFRECRRVLKPGGAVRIAVPAFDRVWKHATPDYFRFAKRWAPSEDLRGAMHAMAHAHGHKALWTDDLLRAALYLAGFESAASWQPGVSQCPELKGVEGHGKVIGDTFNEIETIVVEAR